MPIRDEPFSLHGGCNCKAVRYEVNVPAKAQRPATPYATQGVDVGDATIPAVVICHCGDCRAVTASLPAFGLITESKTVNVRLQSTSSDAQYSLPAADVFDHTKSTILDTHLKCYKSSPKRSRWFCGRCGTPIGYTVDPGVMPQNVPPMLDIWLGTVDADELIAEDMKPERMLCCDRALPWVQKMSRDGCDHIPEHPLTKIDILCNPR